MLAAVALLATAVPAVAQPDADADPAPSDPEPPPTEEEPPPPEADAPADADAPPPEAGQPEPEPAEPEPPTNEAAPEAEPAAEASPEPAAASPEAPSAFRPSKEFDHVRGDAQPATTRSVSGMGIAPTQPEFGGEVGGPGQGVSVDSGGGLKLQFHGYLRVPLRAGWGPRDETLTPGGDPSGSEFHAPPRTPDLSFTNWNYTHNHTGPWVDLVFSYGNERASFTASIATRNPTVGSYRNLQYQYGINTAFVTLNFPEAFGSLGGLRLDVGAFSNRYGTAGRYNAGQYMTYLFGRTRVAGETLTADLYLTDDVKLTLEHGIGAKLDIFPYPDEPFVNDRADYLPYPGPAAQGSTWLHHAHAGLALGKVLQLGGHYITVGSPDDRRVDGLPSQPGKLDVYGPDLRFEGGVFGFGYVGYSHIYARDVLPLADALEVLHSQGGWSFSNNYFGRYEPRETPVQMRTAESSGTVDSVALQYTLSLGSIARYPERFWGNGPDLTLTLYGMFNRIKHRGPEDNDHDKLKFGGEAIYTPLSFLGVGLRHDVVQPRMDNSDYSFQVLTPQIVLRTDFRSHEQVVIKYSRYFPGARTWPAFPYSGDPRYTEIDENVVSITGSMWW